MDTQRQFALYDEMSLPQLADRLEELDTHRTPVGWSPDDAVHRSTLVRRIVSRVARGRGGEPSALPCRLDVEIRSMPRMARAVLVEIADGGIAVEVDGAWAMGALVDVILPPSLDEHALRIQALVGTVEGQRLRLTIVAPTNESQERRLHRFVREALRHRAQS